MRLPRRENSNRETGRRRYNILFASLSLSLFPMNGIPAKTRPGSIRRLKRRGEDPDKYEERRGEEDV